MNIMKRDSFRWGLVPAILAATLILAAGSPRVVSAQEPIKLTMQASWPTSLSLYENFTMFATTVEKLSNGRLKIETLPGGAVVGALEVLDATNRGVIDGAHTAPGYWVGKDRAAIPLSHGPVFGMDFIDMFGWYYEGGGWELLQEWYQKVLKMDVVSFPILPAGPQALGWFNKKINSFEDMKGMKYRIYGSGAEVYGKLGIAAVTLPGSEILPAMERGVLDGADWVNCLEDSRLGFQTVTKIHYSPGMHEPVTVGDLLINKTVWDKLSPELQFIVRVASQQTWWRWYARFQKQTAEACLKLIAEGVQIYRTPDELNYKFLETWDEIQAQDASESEFYKKVVDSQKKYAGLMVPYRLSYWPSYDFRGQYYWKDEVYLK